MSTCKFIDSWNGCDHVIVDMANVTILRKMPKNYEQLGTAPAVLAVELSSRWLSVRARTKSCCIHTKPIMEEALPMFRISFHMWITYFWGGILFHTLT